MSEWMQYAAMLLAVTTASAWLTSRWLVRRRAGSCSSCNTPCEHRVAGTRCDKTPHDERGRRSPALRVHQSNAADAAPIERPAEPSL
jgi:hypothetical protein